MNLELKNIIVKYNCKITISGSKSETNRMLFLQALYQNISLENSSNSDDSEAMSTALKLDNQFINVHHAGTAMRFLTAYFALQEGREVFVTGSQRMQERPIEILVSALNQLGANIEYVNNQGFPPLKIFGRKLSEFKISMNAGVSSQYISALLLIAPTLEKGLELTLEGKITSVPYLKMTLKLLENMGINTIFENNLIVIKPKSIIENYHHVIESDWSSASYFYSIIAMSNVGTSILLSSFKKNSLQADAIVVEIYENFGVTTIFNNNTIEITKTKNHEISHLDYDFSDAPDIAQTVAVTCFGMGVSCHFTGLHTLKIKETDRLVALQNELTKLGAIVFIDNESLKLEKATKIIENQSIATYQDHRMAMAFAPLALKTTLTIENAEVVSKSYPNFWKDMEEIGIYKTI